jgi:MATE family multidrug resistance protein
MLALAWPVVLAELGWMAMGLTDAIMVGPLGEGAIGAVGLANSLFFAPTIFGLGLLFGLDTLVSQAFGAGRHEEGWRWLGQGTFLALAMTPPLMAVVAASPSAAGWAGVTPGARESAARYLGVAVASVGPLLVFTALRRYLQAVGAVRPIMVALLTANLVNVAVNWVLIEGRFGAPALGVVGAAWATVISRIYMMLLLLAAVRLRGREERPAVGWMPLRPDGKWLRRLVALGFPAAAQVTLEVGVFALGTVLAGTLGRVALDAHQIALNYSGLMFMVPLGLSSAGAVRVGQALGRRDPAGASAAGWTAIGLGTAFMLTSALVMLLAPGAIIGAFTGQPAVRAAAVTLLAVAAAFQLFDGLQVVATGNLRGAGDTRTSMRWNLLAHWGIGLPVGWLLAFPGGLGITGLWIGLSAGLIVAGVALLRVWARRAAAFARGERPAERDSQAESGRRGPAPQSPGLAPNAVAADPADRPH